MADEADDHDHPPPYPLDANRYKIREEMGRGLSSIVFKAVCTEMPASSSVVAIKLIDPKKSQKDILHHQLEARISVSNHPTLLRPHCFFAVTDATDATAAAILMVMPFMLGGSLQSIVASSYPDGLPEPYIAAVLKEILTALAHIHGEYHFYGDLKAGKILIDSDGSVRLADPSLSSSLWFRLVGTRYWMPPEAIPSRTEYGEMSDIWSFGITALELAHGRPPLSNSDHLPLSKKITRSFKHMVGLCLDRDPSKRPSAKMLLKHPFFQNCGGGSHFLIKNMVPKAQQIDRLARKLICEEEVGEIHGWKFNEERFVLDFVEDAAESGSCDGGGGGQVLNRELVLKVMMLMLESLDYRKERVQRFTVSVMQEIRNDLMWEMTTEEMMKEIVNVQEMENVEDGKIKWFEMEMELEKLFALL